MRFQSVGVVFTWVLMTLSCYRLQRIVTTDSWWPSVWFRNIWTDLHVRATERGKSGNWQAYVDEFFSCPWCFGTFSTWVAFAIAAQFVSIPLPVLQAVAASAIVGIVGERDS